MAHAVVDEAIRNVVAVGADPDAVALLDNFSWGDPRRPSTLGALVEAVEACCDASLAHGAPFVSGKDSLNNEYLGRDGQRHSVPPTLVITAVAARPRRRPRRHAGPRRGRQRARAARPHPCRSSAAATSAWSGLERRRRRGRCPAPDPMRPAATAGCTRRSAPAGSSPATTSARAGSAVALAEMAIGGRLGVDCPWLGHDDLTVALFSESTGRFVVRDRAGRPRVARRGASASRCTSSARSPPNRDAASRTARRSRSTDASSSRSARRRLGEPPDRARRRRTRHEPRPRRRARTRPRRRRPADRARLGELRRAAHGCSTRCRLVVVARRLQPRRRARRRPDVRR